MLRRLKAFVFTAAVALTATAFGQTVGNLATVEGTVAINAASGTQANIQTNSGPVVSAILSAPGTVNGYSYTSYAFLVNDGTGSCLVYAGSSSYPLKYSAGQGGGNYSPTVSDSIDILASYEPYHQIPEIEGTTASPVSKTTVVTLNSQGNPSASPITPTIASLNNLTTLPLNIAGYEITLNDVTISGLSATFGITNQSGSITDHGGNAMALYYWPTSYSVSNQNLYGLAVPSTPVDLTGFVSIYPGTGDTPEFTPISMTAYVAPVPEPASLGLLGIGAMAM